VEKSVKSRSSQPKEDQYTAGIAFLNTGSPDTKSFIFFAVTFFRIIILQRAAGLIGKYLLIILPIMKCE
jgi:hypothetical protein